MSWSGPLQGLSYLMGLVRFSDLIVIDLAVISKIHVREMLALLSQTSTVSLQELGLEDARHIKEDEC